MGHGNKSVPLTYYEISAVKHKTVNKKLDYSSTDFTYLKNAYTPDGMELISIDELGRLVNDYKNVQGGKQNARCLLKGLYKDGYNGVNCVQNSPYLFFDIDVKDGKENTHLVHPDTNQAIFNELEKVAVICWRSNSGNGIAGVLYVPQLTDYLNDNKDLHRDAGEAITKHLSEYLHDVTGIKRISFDQAQSKFRQVRFLAEQKQTRSLNQKPFMFSFKVEKKVKEITAGVPAYRPTNYQSPYGTIHGQFNNDNDILTVALDCGLSIVGSANGNEVRVKHHATTSKTSGVINRSLNVFFNYSGSLSHFKRFTPSQLVCTLRYGGNWGDFSKHLRALDYKEKQRAEPEIKDASKALKDELQNVVNDNEASEIIFNYCHDLQTLSNERKRQFIKDNCTRDEFRKFFVAYLNLNDYKIKYDKGIIIKEYVAEKTAEILEYVDQQGNTILRAETGKGKTFFVFSITKYRPKARVLVLVPLTVIIEQNRKDHKGKAVFLDGTSSQAEFERAQYESIVFATYEQGAKILHSSPDFDYLVIDEVHQLITANSFKRDVIADLTQHLNKGKVIGLTGTPNALFKRLGYKFLNVDIAKPNKTKVEVRFSNTKPYDIALTHIINAKGKTLVRLNDIEALKALKEQLVKMKLYKENEIFVSYSHKLIKTSKDYIQLAHDRIFYDGIKVVLTTALIDEGLSIDQMGFTDIVFIETSYHPRPEAIKQFYARFRNTDSNRKNYLYLRATEDQTPTRFNPLWEYNNSFKALKQDADQMGDNDIISTYGGAFSNDVFYYEDNRINPYYLAYSVTDTLFMFFNIEQFLNYLEINYNLEFTKNTDFELDISIGSYETEHRKKVNQQVANAWVMQRDEVLQSLYIQTESKAIRSDLNLRQMYIDPKVNNLVIKNTKAFEKLYQRHNQLEKLGHVAPDEVLIRFSPDTLGVTLNSNKIFKDEITIAEIHRIVMFPKSKVDISNRQRLIDFTNWCKEQKEFTNTQMQRQLKKLKVYKNSDLRFPQIERVLNSFSLDIRKDTNTGAYKVTTIEQD